MRLIDNYLSAVAGYLPKKNREDIKAELKSSLYEQLEDQSAALQRDLSEQEQAEFLKRLGHPLKVAGEYAPQKYLIGPTLFPYYLQTLKVIAVVLIVLHVLLSIVVTVASDDWAITSDSTVGRFVHSLLVIGALVTIGFALMERSGLKVNLAEHWDPLSLRDRHKYLAVDRRDLTTSIICEFVLLLWWIGVLVLPAQVSWAEASLTVARSPAWSVVFWPVIVLLAGSGVLSSVMMWIGYWGSRTITLRLIIETAAAPILVYLIRAPELVVLETTGEMAFESVRLGVTVAVRVVLWISFAMVLFDLVKFGKMAFRLARGTEP